MMQRILSRVLLSIGALALMCGAVVHGSSRDSRNAEDRKQMTRGAEIAIGGLVLVSASVLARKVASDNSLYQDGAGVIMRGDPRGVVLFALELSLLRAIRDAGGASSPGFANGNWDTAAELCRLNLLSSAGEVLKITPDGERALRLTAQVPNGRVGFISMERWTGSERVPTRDSAQVNEAVQ